MDSGRQVLQTGTRIKLQYGSIYRIAGAPIGFGGSSILYPAQRLVGEEGREIPDGMLYALKECFPTHSYHFFCRNENGAIVPEDPEDEDAWTYLNMVQRNLTEESDVVHTLLPVANYILPIWESSQKVIVTAPGQPSYELDNTVVVMESIQRKGSTLYDILQQQIRFKPADAMRILQQLLLALQEIHNAGYLHLDLHDGNIFLRGALKDGGGILTLVDFGSARKLTEEKTDPIDEEMLLTTEGFCPPEARRSSRRQLAEMGIPGFYKSPEMEGEIRLDVKADLYLAGCLARYLLTGERMSSQELLSVKGRYLQANQVPLLKCTDITVERIQRMLTRALNPDPQGRYHSAGEMLQEVTEILGDLTAKAINLGSVKYDAFICYKHGELDSAVALKLQQLLEHYRMPKLDNVRRRPITRVFVDEGELSSCADMGEEIDNALKNSANLIVLCSPDTPKSVWVEREIEAYRKFHKDAPKGTYKILTVLTSGTPETSYPAALITDGDDPFKQYSAHAQGKNAREVIRKLKGGEMLKLVAPMVNVPYDTLKQRQLVYRRKRAALAAACLTAMVAYAANRSMVIARQAATIAEEQAAARRNASLYLTEQAQQKLMENDRLGALELLLGALPPQGQEDTAAAQTEYQLHKALGTYITPIQSEGYLIATGSIDIGHTDYFLDDTGDHLFSWDVASDTLDVWDTKSMTKRYTVNVQRASVEQSVQSIADFSSLQFLLTSRNYSCQTSEDFLLPDGKTLIYRGRDRVTALDYTTGTNRWSIPIDRTVTMAITDDKSHLMVLTEEGVNGSSLVAHILDTDTGSILRSTSFSIGFGWDVSADLQISRDLKWAAIPLQEKYGEDVFFSYGQLHLLNLETGELRLLPTEKGRISRIKFVEDRLVTMQINNYTLTTVRGNGLELSRVSNITIRLGAYDPATGSLIWQQSLPYYSWNARSNGIEKVAYDTGEESGQGVLFFYERYIVLVDLKSGRILRCDGLPDGILEVKTQDNGWYAICSDGSRVTGDYNRNSLSQCGGDMDALQAGYLRKDTLYLQTMNGNVIRYQESLYDENYENVGTLEGNDWQLYDVYLWENGYRLILIRDNELAVMDTGEADVRYYSISRDQSFNSSTAMGVSEDGRQIYWHHTSDDADTYALDLESGAITEYWLPLSDVEVSWWNPVYLDGRIVYAAMRLRDGQKNELTIYGWNPGDAAPEALYNTILPGETDAVQLNGILTDHENNACFLAVSEVDKLHPNRLLRLDVATKQAVQIPVAFLPEEANEDLESWILQRGAWQEGGYCWSCDGKTAVFCHGAAAYAVDAEGTLLCRIPQKERVLGGIITPDGGSVVLATKDGTLSRWRLQDGLWMGSVALEGVSAANMLSENELRFEYAQDGSLVAYTDSYTFLLDLSADTLEVSAAVKGARRLEGDRFWFEESANNSSQIQVGYFPRYKVEDLRRMAQEELMP